MLVKRVAVDKKCIVSFSCVSWVFWTFFAASSAPTPLYQLYQREWGFDSVVLSVIFASYAVGMLSSLLVVGTLSDYLGRKPVLAAALLLELVAMLLFVRAFDVQLLILARFFQGLATGTATAVLMAFLLDIDERRAPVYSSVLPLCGVACGVVLSSMLIDHSAAPLRLVYGVFGVCFVVQLIMIAWLVEPVRRRGGAWRSLKPVIGIPLPARKVFFSILPMNTAVWSLNGFFLTLVPSLLLGGIASGSALASGLVVALMSFSAALAVIALRGRDYRLVLRLGVLLLAMGVLGILGACYFAKAYLFCVFTVIAGAGSGAVYVGISKCLLPLSPPDQRAALASSYYIVSQLALIVPSVCVGVLVRFIGLSSATYIYGGCVLLFLAFSGFFTERQLRLERASVAA